MNKMMEKVGVVGGGFGGLASAYFLTQLGMQCRVFERREKLSAGGGGIIVYPNGMRILDRMGVVDKVIGVGVEITEAHFSDWQGRFVVSRSMGSSSTYGYPSVFIKRGSLLEIVYNRLAEHGIEVEFGKNVERVGQRGRKIEVGFEDGDEIEVDFLVGADGVHSKVREFVEPRDVKDFMGLVYFGGVLDECNGNQFRPDVLNISVGPSAYFAYSYTSSIESNPSILWHCLVAVDSVVSQSHDSKIRFAERVFNEHSHWCSPIPDFIGQTDDFVLSNIWKIERLSSWYRGGAVLIGDAAHSLGPLSGHGTSLALEDACQLAECVSREGGDFERAFREFQNLRSVRVKKVLGKAERTTKLMMTKWPAVAERFRNCAFGLMIKFSSERMLNSAFRYEIET